MQNDFFNSISWTITTGIKSGYELDSQQKPDLDDAAHTYQVLADETLTETGVYISAVITSSRTVYNKAWGCPEDGEYTITFSGTCNPTFSKPEQYLKALHILAERIKRNFHQATLLLEIVPVHLEYFRKV